MAAKQTLRQQSMARKKSLPEFMKNYVLACLVIPSILLIFYFTGFWERYAGRLDYFDVAVLMMAFAIPITAIPMYLASIKYLEDVNNE